MVFFKIVGIIILIIVVVPLIILYPQVADKYIVLFGVLFLVYIIIAFAVTKIQEAE